MIYFDLLLNLVNMFDETFIHYQSVSAVIGVAVVGDVSGVVSVVGVADLVCD